jgi:hypothetical protein
MPPHNQTRLEPPMWTMNPGELNVDDARGAELVVEARLGQPAEHRVTEVEVALGHRVIVHVGDDQRLCCSRGRHRWAGHTRWLGPSQGPQHTATAVGDPCLGLPGAQRGASVRDGNGSTRRGWGRGEWGAARPTRLRLLGRDSRAGRWGSSPDHGVRVGLAGAKEQGAWRSSPGRARHGCLGRDEGWAGAARWAARQGERAEAAGRAACRRRR